MTIAIIEEVGVCVSVSACYCVCLREREREREEGNTCDVPLSKDLSISFSTDWITILFVLEKKTLLTNDRCFAFIQYPNNHKEKPEDNIERGFFWVKRENRKGSSIGDFIVINNSFSLNSYNIIGIWFVNSAEVSSLRSKPFVPCSNQSPTASLEHQLLFRITSQSTQWR